MHFSYGNVFLKLCYWNYVFASESAFLQNGSNFFFLFFFSNLGPIMTQQTSIPVKCFMARGWYTSCHPISKMHIVGEGPGETPSTLRRLSYLINSFLTDIKHLSKNYPGGTLFYPLLMSISKVSLALIYFNKTLLHKKLQVVKPHLWPQMEILWRSRIPE